MGGAASAIGGILPTSGGASPTKLYDSYNATGQGTWNGNGVLSFPGQENFQFSVATTVTKISLRVTATGNISTTTISCFIYSDSSGNLGSIVGQSDAVTGDNSWANTSVDFNFSTPVSASVLTNYHIGAVCASTTLGSTLLEYTTASGGGLISGQLSSWVILTKINEYPTTFPGYDIQTQIWGTTP